MIRARRQAGVTLVELLVVMVVAGILLGTLTAYFAQQTRDSARLQTQHDLDTKVRAVGEMVLQDLQIAGSQAVVLYDGSPDVKYIGLAAQHGWPSQANAQCTSDDRSGCITLSSDSTTTSLLYATSLENAPHCRLVAYRYDADAQVLYRHDDPCDAASGAPPEDLVLADGITKFEIEYHCAAREQWQKDSSGKDVLVQIVPPSKKVAPEDCYAANTVIQEATLTVASVGRGPRSATLTAEFTASALTPNLRRADPY